MAVCSRCGAELEPRQRFCGSCGLEMQAATQQTTPQPTVSQSGGSQVVYTPPAAQANRGQRYAGTARVAMALAVCGGLLGILWGAIGPYLTQKYPAHIQWAVYGTGLKAEILLIIGLAFSILTLIGAAVVTRAIGVARLLLIICGLAGFILGPPWLIPGAVILAAAGLALAAKRAE